jgi:hypothetical protein
LTDEGASRATMVLLPKQVHLQKDVGAGGVLVAGRGLTAYIYVYVYMEENLQAAREIDKKLKKVAISNI